MKPTAIEKEKKHCDACPNCGRGSCNVKHWYGSLSYHCSEETTDKSLKAIIEKELKEEFDYAEQMYGMDLIALQITIKKVIYQIAQKYAEQQYQKGYVKGLEGAVERDKEWRSQIVKLEADIAHAVGYCRGLGYPETYLEKRYPKLKQK